MLSIMEHTLRDYQEQYEDGRLWPGTGPLFAARLAPAFV
jgi:hypothetical protein